MRTTLTLDDDVARRLQAEARRSGRPFKVVVNEFLRAGLAQRRTARQAEPFEIPECDLGGPQSGVSLDNIGALLEQIEGPARP